jgi:hypothetical protein
VLCASGFGFDHVIAFCLGCGGTHPALMQGD